MKEIKLKNGKTAILRSPIKEDAQAMIDYLNIIGGESDFITFGKNEFSMNVEAEQDYIERINSMDNSKNILIIIEDEIVGIASITSVQKERMKHNGTLGISIRKKYWGIGLGSEIMTYLIDWAKSNKITKKINLLVREDNIRGVKLYEKFGFEKEGLLKKDICVNGVYYNTIAMGLYID
ncbi:MULTISPECIES: GNAT family N-acetyltransferase [Paraclostridium]|uniref:GNAT family N-acetyltransferase n=1 Tax=Paraclostridium bifermentans TaxID=1490 RepID=A0AA44DKD2_PARBF|nr:MULTISPECIES: GNAT family protein [Paraclostridium]MBN8046584.1 GNAT family N-acetyltransferase [Paraclostridium bifermentans]MBZ6004875.1 GNAT family N-acetyltransferase [Paraclostridium bifermentans]MDU0296647.1 GNAT family protein [Paraclostridium sp. MRS3W1]NME09347.1 GNAT family N-acetyltransferase [Paraclostridium bifermentans]